MNKNINIVLASNSKRRINILREMGFDFITADHKFNENILKEKNPIKFVEICALEKAKSIQEDYQEYLIIGSDTIVFFNNEILGKPKNRENAKYMLSKMSGNIHYVYTGIALIYNKKIIYSSIKTEVKFKILNEKEIDLYLDNANYMDKAGAYAIQEHAAFFIDSIKGDYFNIVGFPIKLFSDLFSKITGVEYYEYLY